MKDSGNTENLGVFRFENNMYRTDFLVYQWIVSVTQMKIINERS